MTERKCDKCGFIFPADQKSNMCPECGHPAELTGLGSTDDCRIMPDEQAKHAIAAAIGVLSRMDARGHVQEGAK